MKKYILLLFLGLTVTLNAQKIELAVEYVEQEETDWCSAACSKCVLDYKGINISQCNIMEYVRKNSIGYGSTSCCSKPVIFCNKGVDLGIGNEKGSVKDILWNFGNLPSKGFWNSLWVSGIEDNLTQNRPLIVQLDYNNNPYAHAVVIFGIEKEIIINYVHYMDPGPPGPVFSGGKHRLDWYTFHINDDWWWRGTLELKGCLLERDYPCCCYNGIFEPELGEKGLDCGGPCPDCTTPPPPPPTWHCYNRKKDFDETGVDCGGVDCPPCEDLPPCANCVQDAGEVMVDCGGTCAPCYDVLDEIMITNTAQLYVNYSIYHPGPIRSEIMAFNKITAGGTTTVTSGEKISFITEDEGSIVLLPGFKVEKGANFTTQRKDLSGSSRICGAICKIEYVSAEHFVSWGQFLTMYDLFNAVEIEYRIYDFATGQKVYENSFDITRNGIFELWNCLTGTVNPKGDVRYYIVYEILYCNGAYHTDSRRFLVHYPSSKSSNAEPNTSTPPDPSSSLIFNNIPPQENTTPSFSIIPNPNLGAFQIETNFPLSDIANLKITNSLGATVYEIKTPTSNTVQLPATASGQLFVVVRLRDGRMLTQKMMVQR